MKAALAASPNANAKASTFVVYPEAGHAFNADYRSSYVEAAAKDGWQRCPGLAARQTRSPEPGERGRLTRAGSDRRGHCKVGAGTYNAAFGFATLLR